MGAPDAINELLDNDDTASDLSNALAESMAKGGFNTSITKDSKTGEITVRIGDYKKPAATKETSTEVSTAYAETKLEDPDKTSMTEDFTINLNEWASNPKSELGKEAIKELGIRARHKRMASLSNAIKESEANPIYKSPKFAEAVNPDEIMDKTAPAHALVSGLEKQTPEMRAENGAKFGSQIGFKNGGHMGAVIGGAIGAYAARGMGQVKSGEHDTNIQLEKFGESLNTMKISDKNGNINFDDGTSVPLPQGKLTNLRASVTGKSEREPYEYDTSNPFTNRTTTVVKPLALFIAGGILKTKDEKAVERISGTICNALQTGAKDINTIYKRAQNLAVKLGVKPEQMAAYMQGLNLPESQAKDIKKGLEILYAGH